MSRLFDAVPQLVSDTRNLLVPLVRGVGAAVVLRHQVAGTRATVGYDYWMLLKDAIQRRLRQHPDFPFRCDPVGRVTHQATGIPFFFYRCGSTPTEELGDNYPRSGKAAVADAENKLYGEPLFPAPIDHISQATIVLAFFGDAEDGAYAMHFGVVGATNQKRITRWRETVRVWVRGDDDRTPSKELLPELPPAAMPDDFEVPKKKRKRTHGENAE